ncbi:hypothetical protein GN958_ATG10306 [Phytophthora infestans]|uniref:Uncharacterized protein n=1 Tax=Phytophthora infestans TaxID=4787 RepID=A0A8S9UIX3_PHYIN|nr:hypothetical protein GN958_ATG10306 [Phytophthora infestans]
MLNQSTRSSRARPLSRSQRMSMSCWHNIKAASTQQSLPATSISNGFKRGKLEPSASCIASSQLVTQLEKLSLLEGKPVEESDDFAVQDIIEETNV